MVVQKNWNTKEASLQNSETENSTTTLTFQVPRTVNVRTSAANIMQTKQPISRQIAINTLAAMHRRFSLPGPVQPHSRPIAEFRASANKSLDTLRQTIQSAVSRDIDQVIKKYLEKFFVPAVNNIRLNLGGDSVNEDQVKAVCRAMLDAARLLYAPRPTPSQTEGGDGGSNVDSKFGIKQEVLGLGNARGRLYTRHAGLLRYPADTSDKEWIAGHNLVNAVGGKTYIMLPTSTNKRKETDSEIDFGIKRKKIKEEIPDGVTPPPTPSPAALRDPDKWDPARLTSDTLFIMGSHAHKVLGLGNARGRLYTRHAGLLRYPADTSDKEWIAGHNLVNAVGGKTYIMVLEDIEELAKSEAYKHTSLPMLGELTGFKAPQFMLRKIKAYILKRNLSEAGNDSPQPSTSNTQVVEPYQLDNIKIEQQDFDTDNFNASQYNIGTSDNTKDFSDVPTDTDLCDIKVEDIDDIKVDGIKVEDLDEMKVEGIKVDDLVAGVDVKIESMDDIDGIKVEDIKLEHDDFTLCKQTDDDQNLEGLLDADIEFLSRNLENIESDADARKAIEKLTGANPDTLTLVGDEFDLSATLNSNNFTSKETKCITVQSTTSGMVHSVPVAHIAPRRITGSTVHYYTSPSVQQSGQRSVHLPQATVTIQSIPSSASQVIRGIPLNTKTGTFSTVMSQGTASTIIGFGARTSNATIIGTPQYVNVTSKSFPTGNILHNAIVSRNIINRTNSAMSFNLSTMKPVQTAPKISTSTTDFDCISTTKDMIDNACNSSVMLKKVLTLGSTGTKSFMMQNTQKVLSTGFATGSAPPPNVTIVSSGTSVGILNNHSTNLVNTSGTLSATHATLSALLSSGDIVPTKKN